MGLDIPAVQHNVRGRAGAHVSGFSRFRGAEIGGPSIECQLFLIVDLPALQEVSFRILQFTIFVEIKVSGAGIVCLIAVGLAHAKVAVTVDSQVRAAVAAFKGALRVIAQHGIGAYTRTDLGGAAGAAPAQVQIIIKIHALAFKAQAT